MRRLGSSIIFALLLPVFTLRAVGSVDLLWQGETYTPPLYKGLSLWSNESRITFVAIPHLPGRDPSTLIYRWSKNGTVLGSLSGLNKRSQTFVDSGLSLPIEVRVDIFTVEGGDIETSTSVALRPVGVKPLVYEDNPLLGLMLHEAVAESFDMREAEVSFSAVPLFAQVSTRFAPAESYTWSTNSSDRRTGNKVTYRIPEGTEGTSLITLRTTNTQLINQPPEKIFQVKFGNENSI